MSNIVTQNGSVVVAGGSVGTDCGCCGGRWYCSRPCCTMPIAYLTLSNVQQEFQPWYNFNAQFTLPNTDPSAMNEDAFSNAAFSYQSNLDNCVRGWAFFPYANSTSGDGQYTNACTFQAFKAVLWKGSNPSIDKQKQLILVFHGRYGGECVTQAVYIAIPYVWERLGSGERIMGNVLRNINIGPNNSHQSTLSFSWELTL